jgi:diguanylate cyclase
MTCSQKDEIQQKNREIEALNEELRIQATTDRLTNLKNFAYFQEELDKRLREYNRAICKHPISIIIIDIDHFKRFNDTYGHTAGNVALREVADRIARLARKMDSPCRYGGEEFVIILPNCDLAGASGLAERIRRAIEMEPIDIDAQMVSITGSMGVAQYVPEETMSCFIERADQSLYRAKEGGRNRVEVFSIEPTTSGLVGGSL